MRASYRIILMKGTPSRRSIVLAFVVVAWFASATAADPRIYWTEASSFQVQRALLDGSGVEDLVNSAYPITGLALDLPGGRMYFAGIGLRRANLDGSNIETIAPGDSYGVALDLSASKVYWTSVGDDAIRRADLSGANVEDLVTGVPNNPSGIALDVPGGKMYWTASCPDKIRRANLNGSNIEDLVTVGLEAPSRIALDLARGKMYWAESTGSRIRRANLDGTDIELLLEETVPAPSGLALDIEVGKLYWADIAVDRIQRANLDGTEAEDIVIGLGNPGFIALDLSCTPGGPDCQPNGMPDGCEIARGATEDCNGNGVPDECDLRDEESEDCNSTGIPDECENDCNGNGLADECDIEAETSEDCNANGIPDECEPDCNQNEVADSCDIAQGTSRDCTRNGIPDECEPDCNENEVADSCDIAQGSSDDCTGNGIPDECEPDCNENGIADSCDIDAAPDTDCDDNGVPDECEMAIPGGLSCAIIEFAPAGSVGPFQIDRNEMIIPAGDVQVEYEILLSGWGNATGSPPLRGFNMTLDGDSLRGSNAVPPNPGVNLATPIPVECGGATGCPEPLPPVPVTQTGTCGVIFPGWCDDFEPAFFVQRVCTDDMVTPCRNIGHCPGSWGCVDNPRFVFPSYLQPLLGIVDQGGNQFQWLGLPLVPDGVREDPDGVTKFVAANLRLIVPEDAKGTYTIRFDTGRDFTFLIDPGNLQIPSTIIHGQLTIGGACCMADGSCEILLESDCESQAGTFVGGFCGGDSDNDGKVDICEVMGDMDGDSHVGLSDWLLLLPCMRGPGADVDGSQCTAADLNRDTSVDLEDVALFTAGFTG